jgi:hypothetical protein
MDQPPASWVFGSSQFFSRLTEGFSGAAQGCQRSSGIHGYHISDFFGEKMRKKLSCMTILYGWAPVMVNLDLRHHVELAQVAEGRSAMTVAQASKMGWDSNH